MTTNHEAVAALPVSSDAVKQGIRDLLFRRNAYIINAAADALDLVAVDPASGAAIQDILLFGRVYHYDSTDTTSAHDGVTVLVSSEGRRYKLAAGTDVVVYSVISNLLTTPPVSPAASIGDAYLVAAAATGAWSGHSDDIAVLTSRGWEFINVLTGRFVYVTAGANADTYYHLKANGTWTAGFGVQSLSSNTVPSSALINIGKTSFIVENQTTNSPPGSPAVGVAYVIGPSPTGAWAGKAGQVAVCEVTGTWTYYAPSNGYQVYDKSLNAPYRYDGSAWTSAAGALIGNPNVVYTASGSTTSGGAGSYTYSTTTAPTTSQNYVEDSVTISYAAKKVGARLRFVYRFDQGNANAGVAALFMDAVANAVDWFMFALNTNISNVIVFETTAADTSSHTYKVRMVQTSGAMAAPQRRRFSVEEFA